MRFSSVLLKLILFTVVLAMNASLLSLDSSRKFHQYVHENIQIKDGLPQNSVYTILQTDDGYMWFGTMEGLVRFDGVDFKIFDSSDYEEFRGNWIWTLFEDSRKNLWVGTYSNGIVVMGPDSNNPTMKIKRIDTKTGLSNNRISSILEDQTGNIWIGTQNGLNRIKDGKIEVFGKKDGLSDDRITALFQDSRGTLWIGTKKGGLSSFNGSELFSSPVKGVKSDFQVRHITSDRKGNLLVSTDSGLVVVRPDRSHTVYGSSYGLKNSSLTQSYEDSDGNIWVGSYGGDLSLFKNEKFTTYTKEDGLTSNVIISIFEDRERNLWVGTLGGGVSKFRDGAMMTFDHRDGLAKGSILAIFQDSSGKLWAGSEGDGLFNFEDGRFKKFIAPGFSKIENTVFSVNEDKNRNIWVSLLDKGIAVIKSDKIKRYTEEVLSDKNVLAIFRDSKDRIWLGTNLSGVKVFSDGEFTSYDKKSGLPGNSVNAVNEDSSGNILIGTGKGLAIFDGTDFKIFTKKDGLSDNEISSLHVDNDNSIWIGTFNGGINLFQNGKISSFVKKDGLVDNTVYSIVEDDNGFLWTSSNKGIFKIEKASLIERSRNNNSPINLIAYGISDGMKSFECNGGFQPAAIKTTDGKLWFSTIKGLVSVDTKKIGINSHAPVVKIEKVVINRKEIVDTTSLILAPGTKELEIKYTGISFSTPEKTVFRFMLEGFDSDWMNAGGRRSAYYTNLPPGNYKFKVEALSRDGVRSSVTVLNIIQKPFFYQRPVFHIAVLIILLIVTTVYIKVRTNMIRVRNVRLKKMINEKARELAETQIELENVNIELKQKYETYRIDDDTAQKMIDELKEYMLSEKPYKNSSLTIQETADAVNLTPHNLSQLINLHLNKNFYNFVNEYRIDDAKRMLKDPECSKKTILQIAYESGFNAKTTFNSVFKKHAGMTPSQYRK